MTYCECGRPIKVLINPFRNPRSRRARRNRGIALPKHHMCRQCFRAAMDRLLGSRAPAKGAPPDVEGV